VTPAGMVVACEHGATLSGWNGLLGARCLGGTDCRRAHMGLDRGVDVMDGAFGDCRRAHVGVDLLVRLGRNNLERWHPASRGPSGRLTDDLVAMSREGSATRFRCREVIGGSILETQLRIALDGLSGSVASMIDTHAKRGSSCRAKAPTAAVNETDCDRLRPARGESVPVASRGHRDRHGSLKPWGCSRFDDRMMMTRAIGFARTRR
jgi:hypothetical protein